MWGVLRIHTVSIIKASFPACLLRSSLIWILRNERTLCCHCIYSWAERSSWFNLLLWEHVHLLQGFCGFGRGVCQISCSGQSQTAWSPNSDLMKQSLISGDAHNVLVLKKIQPPPNFPTALRIILSEWMFSAFKPREMQLWFFHVLFWRRLMILIKTCTDSWTRYWTGGWKKKKNIRNLGHVYDTLGHCWWWVPHV